MFCIKIPFKSFSLINFLIPSDLPSPCLCSFFLEHNFFLRKNFLISKGFNQKKKKLACILVCWHSDSRNFHNTQCLIRGLDFSTFTNT